MSPGPLPPLELAEASAAAMWERDRAVQALGVGLVAVGVGEATLTMTVREDMVNGHGTCHGGFIFTLADAAFAYACNTHDERSVASGADIVFVRAARLGDRLTATGSERVRSGRSGIYDVVVTDDEGRTVAMFRGRSHTIGGSLINPE